MVNETDKEKVVKNIYDSQYFTVRNESQRTINGDSLAPKTIQITGCERIILKDKSLDFQFELTKGKIEDFDEIIINGVTFKKVNND